jgi:nickel/cobalt exporter
MDFHDHSPVQTETHPHDHDSLHHDHHGHHVSNTTTKSGKLGYWKLFLLGVSGGLVPCPAAIAILLAAVATGRIGEGLTYILLFSIGLAAVLIAIGIAVVSAGKLAARFLDAKKFARKVSIASSGLISLIGLVTVINSIRHWT